MYYIVSDGEDISKLYVTTCIILSVTEKTFLSYM